MSVPQHQAARLHPYDEAVRRLYPSPNGHVPLLRRKVRRAVARVSGIRFSPVICYYGVRDPRWYGLPHPQLGAV